MNLAIFASGRGSNAQKIHSYGVQTGAFGTSLIVSNRKHAKVLGYAQDNGIETQVIDRESFYNSTSILDRLTGQKIDMIALAGFLWLIPEYLVEAYSGRLVNIHPALLPKYGGKGMYGQHIHKAVASAGESKSGITIHYVDKEYDEGNIILQTGCKLESDEPEKIAEQVLRLEHHFYPRVVAALFNHLKASGESA